MRFFRHTLYHRAVPANADEVIGHVDLPQDSRLNRVQGEVHCISTVQELVTSMSMYACDGWVLELPDPDTSDNVDDIWDRMVDKDAPAADAFDLDTTGTDTAPFDTVGEFQAASMSGLEKTENEKRWFRRRKMISLASNPTGFDPAADNYFPSDVFKIDAKKGWSPDSWAIGVLGFGNGSMADTTTTVPNTPASEGVWLQLKYLEVVLEQSWMDMAGLTETPGTDPWQIATDLIEELLEPTVVEETAAAFESGIWNVFARLSWDVTVPGRRDFSKALTGAS